MEFQSGQCHFGSSPRHLLGRIQRELPADTAISHSCMQEGDIEEEEEPLYYQLPLSRILSWNRWWHITARVILIAYQKRFWGLLGLYLQEVRGIPLAHLRFDQKKLGHWSWQATSTVKQASTVAAAGKAPLHSTLWQRQIAHILQQGEDVDRKDHLLQYRHLCRG